MFYDNHRVQCPSKNGATRVIHEKKNTYFLVLELEDV